MIGFVRSVPRWNFILQLDIISPMPTIDLTLKQLIEATQQLSPAELRQFMSELSRERFARHADERTLRAAVKYQLPAGKQKRLSRLLQKGNADTLTPEEDAELKSLLDEVEHRSLEKAEALYELLQRGIDLRPKSLLKRRKA